MAIEKKREATDGLERKTQDPEAMGFIKSDRLFLSSTNEKLNFVHLPTGKNRYFTMRYLGPVKDGAVYSVEFDPMHQEQDNYRTYDGKKMEIMLNIIYKIPDDMTILEVGKVSH